MSEQMQGIMKKVGPVIMVIGVLFLAGKMLLKDDKPGQVGAGGQAKLALETPEEQAARMANLKPLSILFIGNSYTYYNDMPKMLQEMANADQQAKYKFDIKVYAQGGANLTQQWQEGKALELIRSQKWDYVVLQDHSFWAMDSVNIGNTYKAANNFNNEIKAVGANTILFQTWARKLGSSWYKDKKYALALRNPAYMQQKFDQYTNELAEKLDAEVIPVGDYWAYAIKQNPTMELFNKDGSHPSPAGSFYTAMLFYRFFSGRLPEEVAYNSGLNPKVGGALRKLASVK